MPSGRIRDLVEWAVTGQDVPWLPLTFGARNVIVGSRTAIRLNPHLNEFDQACLFRRRLTYEAPVFAWLEQHAARRYDAVIDIGANVGVYSVFFDALIRRNPSGRLRRVYAFEPSCQAHDRLRANLRANDAVSVQAFAVAVSDKTGFSQFYEPEGHLTNGSLSRGFAELFSPVHENLVVAIDGSQLTDLFARHECVLLKIDAEGFEPRILEALATILERHRPDLLIEVLPGSDAELNKLDCLDGYSLYHLTDSGPCRREMLAADSVARDWLLTMLPSELTEMRP